MREIVTDEDGGEGLIKVVQYVLDIFGASVSPIGQQTNADFIDGTEGDFAGGEVCAHDQQCEYEEE